MSPAAPQGLLSLHNGHTREYLCYHDFPRRVRSEPLSLEGTAALRGALHRLRRVRSDAVEASGTAWNLSVI
jgi:hypothetical protein